MNKVISVNCPIDDVVAKLNKTVKNKVEIKDKMGLLDYYFGGEKIVQNEFLWDSAKHVNNFFRIKGEIINRDNEHTDIQIKVINKPSYYVIYGLAVWFLLISFLTNKMFLAIFAVTFVVVGWLAKYKYFEDIITDFNKIVGVDDE